MTAPRPVNGRKKTKAQLKKELTEEIKEELKEAQQKKEKIWSNIVDVIDTISLLIAAAGGIMLSNYIPDFREGVDIVFRIPSWGRLIMSFALSFGVLAMTELKGDKAGKKKNWVKRIYFSFANGIMWNTLLGF